MRLARLHHRRCTHSRLGHRANTAIFSIVDAGFCGRFPIPISNQLVRIFDVPLNRPDALSAISYRNLTDCRRQDHVFTEMAGSAFHDLILTGASEPAIVNTADVTLEIFPLLNAKPLAAACLLTNAQPSARRQVVVVNPPRFHDEPHLLQHLDVLDRITVDGYQVGPVARLQDPCAVL